MRASQNTQATPETVWALLMETAKRQEETDRILTEKFTETDRILTEKFAETDRQMKETDRKMNKVFEELGRWGNNHGKFAEEYFFNSFEKGQKNFFGQKFDEIRKNIHAGLIKEFEDEYDIVLINGKSVGIVEVKFKAREDHISKILRKAVTFRVNFPVYENHEIYLGLASLSFDSEIEQLCINNGIAIIKQVGDTVVINDEHLKVY